MEQFPRVGFALDKEVTSQVLSQEFCFYAAPCRPFFKIPPKAFNVLRVHFRILRINKILSMIHRIVDIINFSKSSQAFQIIISL